MAEDISAAIEDGAALDPRQLDRIASVHRGFLYQHLYGVACLLAHGRTPGVRVIVERDEDLELAAAETRFYIQVKTRTRPLQPADVVDALARFTVIRLEHTEGRRAKRPQFAIVSNIEPGPLLARQLRGADWPGDVALVSPAAPQSDLPPAWRDIDTALAWCAARASETPFTSLSPETLVWKLAAIVQHAATGARDRTFTAEDLPGLLEQFVVQLQDFPEPPSPYRPQQHEPPLVTDARLRLLVGFSGAGKTAWASQAALHSPGAVTYFDVADLSAAGVGNSLSRELAARFLGSALEGRGGAMFAERTGLSVLRACAAALAEQRTEVTVVLDNAHRLDADALRGLVEAAPNLRFVLIAQPWPGVTLFESLFQLQAEVLQGWSQQDIAAEFHRAGAPLSVEGSQRAARFTGGLPLYVKSAALVARTAFVGDATRFFDAVEARTHDVEIAQEVILSEAFNQLSPGAQRAAAVLGLAEVALTRVEALALLSSVQLLEPAAAAALRELRRAFMLSSFHGDRLGLHDALRPVAAGSRAALDAELEIVALRRLYEVLRVSLSRTRDVPRLSSVLRLLPRIGESVALADLAGDEMFYEQGDPRTLRSEIERVADDPQVPAGGRFWAHDALAFWESRDGGVPSDLRLQRMAQLVVDGKLGEREQMALAFKFLVLHGSTGDRAGVEHTYTQAQSILADRAAVQAMLRYNYALALFRIGAFTDVLRITETLIAEYYQAIGISEADVFLKKNHALLEVLPKPVNTSLLKRLADCLSLWAHARVKLGSAPMLRRLHAIKLYALAQAARSVITAGQEVVDDFLDIMADPTGALEVMEKTILPALAEARVTDLILPARSHYAIVLAWTGRIEAARAEIRALQIYAGSPKEQAMLSERSSYIEEVASGRVRLTPKVPPPDSARFLPGAMRRLTGKVGRNSPCPCGSGRKFKRCHG